MNRRTYLGAAAAVALAGCSSTEEAENETPEDGSAEDGTASDDGAEVTAFDDFEDISEWDVPIGTLSADADRTYTGSQSARLESGDGDDQVRVVRDLETPRDLSGTRPALALATEEQADIVVQLLDEDGDRIDFRQRIHTDTSLVQCNFGIDTIDGEPDWSAVSEVQIIRWTGEDDKGAVWVDDLRFVDAPETGQVMLQFDGGYETDYTRALPILEEYDFPAVSFLTTGRIREADGDEGEHLVRDQVTALADAGWTIGSHSAHGADLTDLSSDRDPETEVSDAVAWLEDAGFESGARYFSYPYGRYDRATLEAVTAHHDLAFAGRYPSQGAAANPYLCSRVTAPDADEARSILDLTAERGGITSLAFGELDDDAESTLAETVDYLAELESAGELEVILPSDVEDTIVH
ncbi:polysaccharide deacetylase family protein [Natrinema altunense]|uniref:Polysaccharide deacetylase n=1 Tax=Natrinema altunense (strain JCM 12890 / CGMCC 1.3731 / AJ2) TaxID=1227494 RepID=L9ZJK1_NATA2|nr:polysaccharide deacetylase family protein [Natrinema altunense]ELY86675.1 polysaccharide deacetylase [Natrinema altunense JCM 12890]